jgi:hypothetical protein
VLGLLGDDGVAEGPEAVHPIGKPMSVSTQSGFNCPGRLPVVLGFSRSGWPAIRIASTRVIPELCPSFLRFAVAFAEFLESPTVAVGQPEDEDSLSPVRCTDFRRCVQADRSCVTEELQVFEHISETEGQVAGDVLEEHSAGLQVVQVEVDGRPQVSRVRLSGSLTGRGKGLAGVSSCVPVDPGQVLQGEVAEISAPDRASIQPPFLHRFAQVRGSEGFPLHHANGARVSPNAA